MKRIKTETRVYKLDNDGALLLNGNSGMIHKDGHGRGAKVFYGNDGRFMAVNHKNVVYGIDNRVEESKIDNKIHGELELISEETDNEKRTHYVDSFCDIRFERSSQIKDALKEAQEEKKKKAKRLLELKEIREIVGAEKPADSLTGYGVILEKPINIKDLPDYMRIKRKI